MILTAQSLELPAALFGLLNVYLAARANMWNWLFGIATTALYITIFLNVKLYADMGLQAVFLLLQFYGYYQWVYGGVNRSTLVVQRASKQICVTALLLTIILFWVIVYILQNFTDSTTVYGDAFITAASLVAQWMFSKKWLENWWLWIVVDIVSVGVYLNKGLYLTSALYSVLLIIAVSGYFRWKKIGHSSGQNFDLYP